ncbi:MAG: T9SS type A sorting domain-containing protein [Bacteroidota bacterium]
MSRLFRLPSLFLAGMYTCTIVILLLVNGRPGFLDEQGVSLDKSEAWRESVKALEYFYEQRSYGNPGINIGERLLQAWEAVAFSPQSAMMKPFPAANSWRLEGPANIGGRMRAVLFHPTQTNIIYAGAASGGVWKSTDLGLNWRPLTDAMPRLAVSALAIDINNPDILFAGTGEPLGTGFGRSGGSPYYDGLGVMRTDDGGETWNFLPWPTEKSAVHRIALHPQSSDTLLVASIDKLWKSTDGGQNWISALNGHITEVLYKPGDPSTVFAAIGDQYGGSSNGIYISHSGGDPLSWTRLDNNLPPGDSTARVVMSIPASNPERIYAAIGLNRRKITDGDVDFKGVFVSNDGGATWGRELSAISNDFTRGQGYYDLTIMANPSNPDIVFLGGIDMHRSITKADGFAKMTHWEYRVTDPKNPAYVHADQHYVAFKPDDPNTVVIACDGGIFLSSDGGSNWFDRSSGLVTTQFYGISYAPSNPSILYGGTQDNSNMRLSTPGQTNWHYLGGGDGGRMAVDPKNNDLVYLTINSTPYRTFDGVNFQPLVTGLNGYRGNWVRPMVLDPNGDRLYTASDWVHRLSPAKDATGWLTVSQKKLVRSNGVITDLDMPEPNPRWMYSASSDGKVYVCENLFSLDTEWFEASTGLPNRWISDIHVGWGTLRTVYAALSGYGSSHAWKTVDGGNTWIDISGDLPDIPANSIIPSRTDSNSVFIATDLGVWYTINGGVNWKQFGNGLPNCVCYDMKLTTDNRLVVGTYGRGVWSTDAVTSIGAEVPAAGGLTLDPAWPNPFGSGIASSSTLRFSLPSSGSVQLLIYNSAGRVVATPASGRYEAGSHSATFAAGNLPAGTYLAVLRAGEKTVVRKIALIR